TFTSNLNSPSRGSWVGLIVNAGATDVLIEHARIEYAQTGVRFNGVSATVRKSTIRYFTSVGVHIEGANASDSVIEGNLIDNLNDTAACVHMTNSSPIIRDNTLRNCVKGIDVNRD